MSHKRLDYLDVTLVFAKSCTEGMTENVAGDLFRQKKWFSSLISCCSHLMFIVPVYCTVYCTIHCSGQKNVLIAGDKNEILKSINLFITESQDLLELIFHKECIEHFLNHGYVSCTGIRLGSLDTLLAFSEFIRSVTEAAVHMNDTILHINAVCPRKS